MGPTQVKCPKLNIVTTKKVIFCFDLNKKDKCQSLDMIPRLDSPTKLTPVLFRVRM